MIVDETLLAGTWDEGVLGTRIAEAIPGMFDQAQGRWSATFASAATEALARHEHRATRLVAAVRDAAAELFEVPCHVPEAAGAFEWAREPSWATHDWAATVRPFPPGWFDRFLPERVRRARLRRRLADRVQSLVARNVESLRWAVFQSIDQSFLRFAAELDEQLSATIAATYGATEAALLRRTEQAGTVDTECDRLQRLIATLTELMDGIVSGGSSGGLQSDAGTP